MTREEFNKLSSDGKFLCPDCGEKDTHPRAGCHCPNYKYGNYGARHINEYHHTCKSQQREE